MTDIGEDSAGIRLREQGLGGISMLPPNGSPSSMYREFDASRTTAGHGISHHELRRLSGGMHFMKRMKLRLWWAVMGDDMLEKESGEARKEIGRFLSMLVRYQERAEIPPYWLRVLETSSGLHGNIVFPGNEGIASSLQRAFPEYMRSPGAMQPVDDANGLVGYLSKECTSTATRALGLNWSSRLRGSHRLEGDGDRVSLSRALKRDTIAADAVQPWQREADN